LEYTRLLNQNDRKVRNTGRSFHSKKRIYRTEEHVNCTIHHVAWSNCTRPPSNTRHKEQDTHSPKRIQCLLTLFLHFLLQNMPSSWFLSSTDTLHRSLALHATDTQDTQKYIRSNVNTTQSSSQPQIHVQQYSL